MSIPPLLRVAEVAERLRCSVSTVYGLIESGRLGHHRCPGVRVSEQQLAEYVESTKMDAKREREPAGISRKNSRPRLRHITLQ